MLQLSCAAAAYKLLILQFITFDIVASINTAASHTTRRGTMANGVVKSVRAIHRWNLHHKQLDVDSREARLLSVFNKILHSEPSTNSKGSNEVRNKLRDRMNISGLTLMLKFPNVRSFSAGPLS